VETSLSARQLLTLCLKIELHFGRERPYKNAPRTLDLDLLVYGDERIAEPDLIVPHPRLALRAFVLHPLADIAPELDIP
ncbi:2-amino-4-hydroxy-6-hydroxymethyldihydropteridine diphosphokinase, partial [Pandoraea pneumonica]